MGIVSLSLNDELLHRFDKALKEKGYATRSEAFRDSIRRFVDESAWSMKGENVVVITVIYKKGALKHELLRMQHEYDEIQTMLHMHLDETNCLEIYVVKGKANIIKQLIQDIRKIKTVKHTEFMSSACDV
jgi:CopG family nickel-responsive transcriptional regulator